MSKRFFILFAVGIVIIAAAVSAVLYTHKGNHLLLNGKVLKIRTGALSDQDSIAVLDMRLENPSDVPFEVRQVLVILNKQDGSTADAALIAKMDLPQVFKFNRYLGDQYNDSLSIKDTIPPHGTVDRMIAARFDVPNKELEASKSILISIQDMGGTLFEITQPVK
jgi:hypothetical protein